MKYVLAYRCQGHPECGWQPDPERRMNIDSQCDEHVRKTGHTLIQAMDPA